MSRRKKKKQEKHPPVVTPTRSLISQLFPTKAEWKATKRADKYTICGVWITVILLPISIFGSLLATDWWTARKPRDLQSATTGDIRQISERLTKGLPAQRPILSIGPLPSALGQYITVSQKGSSVMKTVMFGITNTGSIAAVDIASNFGDGGTERSVEGNVTIESHTFNALDRSMALGPGESVIATVTATSICESEDAAAREAANTAQFPELKCRLLMAITYKGVDDRTTDYSSRYSYDIFPDRADLLESDFR